MSSARASTDSEQAPTAGFRHLLVCLDRSEAAEAVFPLACHFARTDQARITLLHVLEAREDNGEVHATDALKWEIVRQEALAYLERLAQRANEAGVETVSRITEGPAAQSVAALAAEIRADLVVLSTTGESGAGDASPLGSTAQKILALARGPVLVAPSGARAKAPRVPPRRILVPLDGSVRSECVIPTAIRLARANAAEILITHVVTDPIRTYVLFTEEDLALAQRLSDRMISRAGAYLEQIRSQLAASGVEARVSVGRATDHRASLLELADAESVDLIVSSAHGSVCNPNRRFGSVTSYAIAHSKAPVLVIQNVPDRERSTGLDSASRLPPRSFSVSSGGD